MRPPASELVVTAWNVQRPSPARAELQARWLNECDADVVVLSEVCGAGGGTLISALLTDGWDVVSPSPQGTELGVLVAARIGRPRLLALGVSHLPRRFAAISLQPGPHTVTLVGLYVPSRGPAARRNVDKRAFQSAVAAALPELRKLIEAGPVVLTGDLNVVEMGHKPRRAVFGPWEYRFYAEFGEHGFIDAYRVLSPDSLEYSWFGRGGNGYRIDHAFISSEHRHMLRGCDYEQHPRLVGLSDHAALTTVLSLH